MTAHHHPSEAGRTEDPATRIREKARLLGFDAVGIARADEPLDVDFDRYQAFAEAGMHGTMDWLGDNREARRRLDQATILEGARSVICLARRYARAEEPERGSVAEGIARYARGGDYHNFVRDRVRRLASFVRGLGEGVRARPIVDDAPVLERAWASRAGLGFIGKHGLLIIPGQGSFVLLGEVVTTLVLPPDTPMAERCGSCTRCLDACPTRAFVRPFVLDPRRCIAYLTIEHAGAFEESLREPVGEHVFGCDVCQDVCPFNRTRLPDEDATRPFATREAWNVPLAALLEDDEEAFLERSRGTPLRRATTARLVRNAVTVLANRGAGDCLPVIERLAIEHPDDGVRSHAAWAAGKLRDPGPADVQPGSAGLTRGPDRS